MVFVTELFWTKYEQIEKIFYYRTIFYHRKWWKILRSSNFNDQTLKKFLLSFNFNYQKLDFMLFLIMFDYKKVFYDKKISTIIKVLSKLQLFIQHRNQILKLQPRKKHFFLQFPLKLFTTKHVPKTSSFYQWTVKRLKKQKSL